MTNDQPPLTFATLAERPELADLFWSQKERIMNSIIQNQYPLFRLYQELRNLLLDVLSDADLAFQPGGSNLTLGQLCRQIGEVQTSYIESFKTFKQDFAYRNDTPGLDKSVETLQQWFAHLDRELETVVGDLSDADIQNRVIDRGENFTVPPNIQLEIYKEALLIFYGKASVYLKALGKTPPERFAEWID